MEAEQFLHLKILPLGIFGERTLSECLEVSPMSLLFPVALWLLLTVMLIHICVTDVSDGRNHPSFVLGKSYVGNFPLHGVPSFKDPVRLIVPFIHGLFFLKSPCHSFHRWTEPWKEDTDPLHCHPSQPLVRLTQPCLLLYFLGHTKDCRPQQTTKATKLAALSATGRTWAGWANSSFWCCFCLGRAAAIPHLARIWVLAVLHMSRGQGVCPSHGTVCHVFPVLSKGLSRHESRACFAVLRADSIWNPSACPGTRGTAGAALSFSKWISQEAASYCNP